MIRIAPLAFAAAVASSLLPGIAAAQTGGVTLQRVPLPDATCESILLGTTLGLDAVVHDAFSNTCGQMVHTRWDGGVPMVTLSDGTVLLAGGADVTYDGTYYHAKDTRTAELYLPATSSFIATGSMAKARLMHTATLMFTGSVLVVGGHNDDPTQPDPGATAEVYNPTLHLFLPAGGLAVPRYWGHTATLLPNGKVLVAGGASCATPCAALASAELYDPATNKFSPTGPMLRARSFHAAVTLRDGRVLIVGGFDPASDARIASAELYDPVTNRFSAAASMNTARIQPSAVMLRDGRVLVSDISTIGTLDIYDPATGIFQVHGSGVFGFAIALNNGKVLLINEHDNLLDDSQLFDPATDAVRPAGANTFGGNCAAWPATLLNNGQVLAYGGAYMACMNLALVNYNAVLYQP